MKKITDKQKRIAYVDVTAELFISAIQKHYISTLPEDAEIMKVELAPSDMIYSAHFHGHMLRFFLCSNKFKVRQEGDPIPRHDVTVGVEKNMEHVEVGDMVDLLDDGFIKYSNWRLVRRDFIISATEASRIEVTIRREEIDGSHEDILLAMGPKTVLRESHISKNT